MFATLTNLIHRQHHFCNRFPAIDDTVGIDKMPTGSTLSPRIVLKHITDLGNQSFWIVGYMCKGGSLALLFLEDYTEPSSLKICTIDKLHIANMAIQFDAIEFSDRFLRHEDLYRLRFVSTSEEAYIKPNIIFRLTGSAEWLPEFDQDVLQTTEHHPKDVGPISPSYGVFNSRVTLLCGKAGCRNTGFDAMANHRVIVVDTGVPGTLTLITRTDLSTKLIRIRVKTLLQQSIKFAQQA